MWEKELNPDFAQKQAALMAHLGQQFTPPIGTRQQWYDGSVNYWNQQPATVDGVLGGYGKVHECDSDTSRKMIEDFKDRISGFRTAVDMGAGIGRIAKVTLLPKFSEVDLVEPAEVQIEKAKANVPNIRKFY